MNSSKTTLSFRANAKLMITGEYLVLRGAKALAIPLKFGQGLKISEHTGSPALVWKTYVKDQYWFDAIFSLKDFVIGNTNDFPTAMNLREILLAAKALQPSFLEKNVRYEAVSKIDFDISWGLGSSSSLLVNIANWARVNPFDLFKRVSDGSGYDIAAAMSKKPVIFSKNSSGYECRELDFYPEFREHLYFAYLGTKRSSAQAVKHFNESSKDFSSELGSIGSITNAISVTSNLRDFRRLMREHEKIVSGVVGEQVIKSRLFSDFSGDIKSLGAWGGDFILLATDMPRDYVISWLRKRDLNVWFSYEDIALDPFGRP
jgi:mevalonate kinase